MDHVAATGIWSTIPTCKGAIESRGDYRNQRPRSAVTWWRLKDEVFAENVDLGVLGYMQGYPSKNLLRFFSTVKRTEWLTN